MNRNDAYRRNVLQAINEFWGEYYRPPTVREIMDLAGLRSTSTTSRVISELHEEGLIAMPGGGGKSRMPVPPWVKNAIQNARVT